jgi:tetratricopeptide (TPR) repeat protein
MTHLRIARWLILLCAFAVGLACAGRRSAIAPPETTPTVAPAVTAAEIADLFADAEGHWAERLDPDPAREALRLYQTLATLVPDDVHLQTRLVRAHYYVANFIEEDAMARDALFLQAIEEGERALARNPAFGQAFARHDDVRAALRSATPDQVGLVMWTGASLAKWVASKGLLVRLKHKSILEAYFQRVRELDDDYYYGATFRFFGALPTKVPGGDLAQSRAQFEEGVRRFPDFFGTRLLFAELYATKAQDPETFRAQLQYVIDAPANAIPEVTPENTLEQRRAQALLARYGELFE